MNTVDAWCSNHSIAADAIKSSKKTGDALRR